MNKMNEEVTNLKDLLRKTRIERGLSLREFGELLSISHSYLNKLEKGVDPRTGKKIIPTIDTLSKIAKGLDMPLEGFLLICGYLHEDGSDSIAVKEDLEKTIAIEDLFKAFENSVLLGYENITLKGEIVSKDRISQLVEAMRTHIV